MSSLRIALTVDVEDYYMSPESIPVTDWDRYEDRIPVGMNRLLSLFDGLKLRATFFFLGWVAERHPDLVRRAFDGGHEIGTHTWDHRPVRTLSPEDFRTSLRKSLDVLESIIGVRPVSHRAPEFSIHPSDGWILEILAEEGLRLDSSINPVATYLYGCKGAPRHPWWIDTSRGPILELPPNSLRFLNHTWPAGGGFFFRALPNGYLRWAVKRMNREGFPAVIYIHPWEFDPDHPRPNLRGREKWIHNRGLTGAEEKLKAFLREVTVIPLSEAGKEIEGAERASQRNPPGR